jgi:glycosyltransferase involved in cell wall biosynthesis
MRLAVFSLCSNQGVPQAQLLFETIKTFLPDADRFLILSDARHPGVPYPDGCVVIAAAELGINDFASLAFRYDRHEFTAAIKPFAFLHLLGARGYTHCLYFDPDIEVFSPLPTVMAALEANASFILTPHILVPAEQVDGPDDIAIMRGGTFNLGFLGVSGTREARDRLGWWARWLRTHCVDDRPIGLFIDQKFMDLMPGLARGALILRDPTLNLAYWNLPQRRFQPDAAGGPMVDGAPLGFFHYSGFDPATPDRLTMEMDLFQGGQFQDGFLPRSWLSFLAAYADRLRAAGHGRIPADSYAYGRFASGVPIPAVARRLFRDDHPAWAGDPFENFEAWAHLPAYAAVPGIGSAVPSLTMQWLQARDPKLVRFPLHEPAGSAHVTRWWLERGPSVGIDRRFLEPQAAAAGLRPLSVQASFPPSQPNRIDATIIAPAGEPGPSDLPALIGQAQLASLERAAGRVEACDIGTDDHKPVSGRVLCVCLAPERLASALAAIGPRLPDKAYRIFIPATERIILSSSFLNALSSIDEIWAPTRFVQASLVLATTLPVIHMPVAWRFPTPTAAGDEFISGGRPYILAEGDGFPGSSAVDTAVLAYAAAFASWPRTSRPVLAIRAESADHNLRAMIAAHDGVIVPANADPAAVIAGAGCVLALHRGEALSLTILRAMAGSVPVVATDYGGCTDLLTPKTGFPVGFRLLPRSGGAETESWVGAWAEADMDHAAWSLRDLFSRPEVARHRAAEARSQLETLYDTVTVAARQARRLDLVERLAARSYSFVAA